MSGKTVATDKAPQAIGPYSQAVEAGGFLFCSGQIPLDPATGELKGSEIGEQTEQVLDNIAAILEAAGLAFADSWLICRTLQRSTRYTAGVLPLLLLRDPPWR